MVRALDAAIVIAFCIVFMGLKLQKPRQSRKSRPKKFNDWPIVADSKIAKPRQSILDAIFATSHFDPIFHLNSKQNGEEIAIPLGECVICRKLVDR